MQHPSGHLGLAAVLSGKADLATVGETPVARAVMAGSPVVVIATLCEIERAIRIVGRKDRGITAVEDLVGRTIGVVAGTTADFFLRIYLTTNYIDPSRLRIVGLAADRVEAGLLAGEVDAVSTWAPHTDVLRNALGANAVVLDDPDIYTMTWNVVTTREVARTRAEAIRRFLRAMARANRFVVERPEETRRYCAGYFGAGSPFLAAAWHEYAFTLQLDQSLVLNLEEQARWMLRSSGAAGRDLPNFLDAVEAEGLKEVDARAVRIIGK